MFGAPREQAPLLPDVFARAKESGRTLERVCLEVEVRAGRKRGVRDQQAVLAGIAGDGQASRKVARALAEAYGTCTLEWLCAAHALFPEKNERLMP